MKMKDPNRQNVRVFLLGNDPDEVELELSALRKAQLSFVFDVARNRQEFTEKLPLFCPDIILADYALPDITGVEAISIARGRGVDVPVIVIAGEGNESAAVDSLRQGAIDYLLKKNISGLAAHLTRAREIWEDRKAKERAEAEEIRLQQLLFGNKKMEAIGRLSGGIAHDFNNILTGIMGYAEICLSDTPLEPEARRRLEAIISIAQKGADLVRQLLIFSRQMATDFKVVDLNEFITDIMHFFKRIVEETIEIRLDFSPDVLQIRCDPSQLAQVMMHLILHARDAMPGGGIITIKTERGLTGHAHFPDGRAEENPARYCCITISDTGTGTDEYHLQRIFDPSFTNNDTGKATGLGLKIVYSVIRAHNGTVAVSSKKGEGTRFTICLPLYDLQRESDDVPFYEKIPAKESERISGTETILVVEDEDELRDMLASFLSSLGYTVVPAHNGHEALLLYRTDPEKFHLVISDMLMPHKGGIELFHEIRKLSQHARFILVTGYSLAGVDERDLAQMTAILRKPYTPKQMVKLMRDIIDA